MKEYLAVVTSLVFSLVHPSTCQETFSINLFEEVEVAASLSPTNCFNRTSVSSRRNVTTQLNTFRLSRGTIRNVAYEGINPLGQGGSLLSFKAEFKCCSIFCKKFSRQISEWLWVTGNVKMDVAEEPNAGIYYNGVLACHSDYLDGFFASVQFTPFQLEGESTECIRKTGSRHYRTYSAVGTVRRITAEPNANTITVKFAFLLTNWSKNFMLKFMKENEHGTLVNINADVIVEKVNYEFAGVATADIPFMAITGVAMVILFFAIIILMCMRTKRGFLKQTWVSYDEYTKIKQRRHTTAAPFGVDNIALEQMQ